MGEQKGVGNERQFQCGRLPGALPFWIVLTRHFAEQLHCYLCDTYVRWASPGHCGQLFPAISLPQTPLDFAHSFRRGPPFYFISTLPGKHVLTLLNVSALVSTTLLLSNFISLPFALIWFNLVSRFYKFTGHTWWGLFFNRLKVGKTLELRQNDGCILINSLVRRLLGLKSLPIAPSLPIPSFSRPPQTWFPLVRQCL